MAAILPSIFMCRLLFSSILLFFSCYSYKACVYGAIYNHVVDINALLPKPICSTSARDSGRQSQGLQISNRYGPCSPLGQDDMTPSSHQILLNDQSRVQSINAKIFNKNPTEESKAEQSNSSTYSIGGGNFVVTVSFGTPKQNSTLILDTGSDITWIQCKPCPKSCYKQQEPLFDPSASSTYRKGPCISPNDKTYKIEYKDHSHSTGFYGCDILSLPPSDDFSRFQFGCGQDSGGQDSDPNFGNASGILGLGGGKLSLVSQTAKKFRKTFSYCLPPTKSSTGYLLFGDKAIASSSSLKFTPLKRDPKWPGLYFLELVGISVGKNRLKISPSVFSSPSSPGTVIDSGTVITRLPQSAYLALRTAFRQSMSKYPLADRLPLMDTCYDLETFTDPKVPTVVLHFGGGTDVSLHQSGILWIESKSQVCLAFAGNKDENEFTIIGNTQQQALNVLYDIEGRRVGFGSTDGCNN